MLQLPEHAGGNSPEERGHVDLTKGADPWGEPPVCQLVSLPSVEMWDADVMSTLPQAELVGHVLLLPERYCTEDTMGRNVPWAQLSP